MQPTARRIFERSALNVRANEKQNRARTGSSGEEFDSRPGFIAPGEEVLQFERGRYDMKYA